MTELKAIDCNMTFMVLMGHCDMLNGAQCKNSEPGNLDPENCAQPVKRKIPESATSLITAC